MTSHRGFLLLAHIAGYASFLATTPTEAGGCITGSLLDELVDTVTPPFRIGNIASDARPIAPAPDGTGA